VVQLFFPRAKNSFPGGPKDQETPSDTVFLELIVNFFLSLNSRPTYSEMTNYPSICSDINVIEICTHHCGVSCYFKFGPATACF
jgi:hypothetical protein